jgi:predicted N-acyltransferase
VIREAGEIVAACPLYVKGNSEGEFVFDWGWADAAYRAGIEYYPKLLVGIPFTPVTGGRFLVAGGADRAAWSHALARALRELCNANELSGVHVNFCREDEFDALVAAGFMPRAGLQYHWHNAGYASFEDYLAHMRSKRRNQTRREIREMERQGVRIEVRVGSEISDDLLEPMFRFYLATVEDRPWGRQYLNSRFFELIAERFREKLCFVVAYHEGEPVAGTFNVQKGDTLYGRYWGTERDIRFLHFNVSASSRARGATTSSCAASTHGPPGARTSFAIPGWQRPWRDSSSASAVRSTRRSAGSPSGACSRTVGRGAECRAGSVPRSHWRCRFSSCSEAEPARSASSSRRSPASSSPCR